MRKQNTNNAIVFGCMVALIVVSFFVAVTCKRPFEEGSQEVNGYICSNKDGKLKCSRSENTDHPVEINGSYLLKQGLIGNTKVLDIFCR